MKLLRRRRTETVEPEAPLPAAPAAPGVDIDIAPNDPLLTYLQSASGAVDIDALHLESPGLEALRAAGMKLVVPLISQGELLGMLNLGPRLSERDYSGDDRKLLDSLAAYAAPAVRVAQLVREQEAEVRSRERLQQELRVATLIQQQFLPKELPDLASWHVAAYYQPAREVGGDFYDFIDLPDGQVGIVQGDVTDKGVPAALVMATVHSLLRAEAPRLVSPGAVLERVNELLYPDIPAQMFVTCLYAVLDPTTGKFTFANAGHNLPYVRTAQGVVELRATGMPLGLMPGMHYEETEAYLAPGDSMLLHSDGLAEAHGPEREMFGFPRVLKLVGEDVASEALIDSLLNELTRFTGPGVDQEDDITLVTLERKATSAMGPSSAAPATSHDKVLAEFSVPSEEGNERIVMNKVGAALEHMHLDPARLDRLKTAVAEATMNAIEHGNSNRAELPVAVQVRLSEDDLSVLITDEGGDREIPEAPQPDIEAKLAGLQTPRGWGLFLIRNMVDDMTVVANESHHTVVLTLHLTGAADADQPA